MMDVLFLALGWAGAASAALFGLALLTRRADTSERWLGAGFFTAAGAGALIMISHSGFRAGWLEGAEVAVTLAAGPLVAFWFAVGAGFRPSKPLVAATLVPAAVWIALLVAGSLWASDRRAIRGAVVFQMLGTAAGAGLFAARRKRLGAATRRIFAIALAGLVLVHASQIARLWDPRHTPPNLVPATLGLLLGALTVAALRQTRLSLGIGRVGGLSEEDAGSLVAALDEWLARERVHLESGLTLGTAARALRVTPARLSRAINRATASSFSEHLSALRVAEAKRLLADKALAHLSVEAVGGRAGFRSRSVFYAEFRRLAGTTPAAYRDREGAGGS